jgi:nucleotide-binding universal stress UspA family protein
VEHAEPPKAVLAATDFSDASQRAVAEALWVSRQASAEFHLVHSIDYRNNDLLNSFDQPATLFPVEPLRRDIQAGAQKRLEAIAESLALDGVKRHLHVVWGTSWQEVGRLAQQLNIDLIALGTVGRSGIKGVFLGNTAERILTTCDCSILAVKPDDFVSPIPPADRPLHPTTESI